MYLLIWGEEASQVGIWGLKPTGIVGETISFKLIYTMRLRSRVSKQRSLSFMNKDKEQSTEGRHTVFQMQHLFQRALFWCYTHKQVLCCSRQYSVLSCEAALAYLRGSRALMHNQGFAWRPCHILSFCCTALSFCKMIHTHSTVCFPHIFLSPSFLWGVDRLHFAFTRPHSFHRGVWVMRGESSLNVKTVKKNVSAQREENTALF